MDILTALKEEWGHQPQTIHPITLAGHDLHVVINPPNFKDVQDLAERGHSHWAELVAKHVHQVKVKDPGAKPLEIVEGSKKPLFPEIDPNTGEPRDVVAILNRDVRPSELRKLVNLITDLLKVRDLEEAKKSSKQGSPANSGTPSTSPKS